MAFTNGRKRATAKQPFCFEVGDGELFAFAGLWERWNDPSGQWIKSCSILTTIPNAVTSADPRPHASDPRSRQLRSVARSRNAERRSISELLKPYDARLMRSYPVSTRINHVANDDEECSRPVELAETQAATLLVEGLLGYPMFVAGEDTQSRVGLTWGFGSWQAFQRCKAPFCTRLSVVL